jgi:[ribosomal protein S5]-alanine N-acetyltransferase
MPLINIPTLDTQGICLRELRANDAQDVQAYASTDEVIRYMFGGWPEPYTMLDAQRWCSGAWRDGGYVWGLEVDGRIIGCCGLRLDSGWLACNAEIGYWIGEPYWKRGITSKAVTLITQWAWQQLPELTRIYAPIFKDNIGSQAVAKACGFVHEGEMPRSGIKRGKIIDRTLWAQYRP